MAPLFLLFSLPAPLSAPVIVVAALSSLVGGIGGINQTNLRALLAYSSIGHVGWLALLTQVSALTTALYFFIYICISVPLFLLLWLINRSGIAQTASISSWPQQYSTGVALLFLSLGGIPPLTGFLAKWLAIQTLHQLRLIITGALIGGALLSLYYYLIFFFRASARTFNSRQILIRTPTTSVTFPLLIAPATLGLAFLPLIYALTLLNKPQRHRHTLLSFRDLIRPRRHLP